MKVAHPHISIDPQRRFGKPAIAGTRICVGDILGWLAAGDTVATITSEYGVTEDDIRDALLFAADLLTYRPLEAEYARRMGARPYGDPFLDGDEGGEEDDSAQPARVAAE